jgi:hypothetical protein
MASDVIAPLADDFERNVFACSICKPASFNDSSCSQLHVGSEASDCVFKSQFIAFYFSLWILDDTTRTVSGTYNHVDITSYRPINRLMKSCSVIAGFVLNF